jgi:hypothetical protein
MSSLRATEATTIDRSSKEKQMALPFDDSTISLAEITGDALRNEFSSPERQFPLLAGKMIRMYGQGPEGRTCGQCGNFKARKYCNVLSEGRRIGKWELNWPACGAFGVTLTADLRHLQFLRRREEEKEDKQ